jgi:hypothetical protein
VRRSGLRSYLVDRTLFGRRRRRAVDPMRSPYAHPRRRGRFGFWGPVPYYSTRTRRGTDVSVGGCGCCLPIPLMATLGVGAALRAVWRRAR